METPFSLNNSSVSVNATRSNKGTLSVYLSAESNNRDNGQLGEKRENPAVVRLVCMRMQIARLSGSPGEIPLPVIFRPCCPPRPSARIKTRCATRRERAMSDGPPHRDVFEFMAPEINLAIFCGPDSFFGHSPIGRALMDVYLSLSTGDRC